MAYDAVRATLTAAENLTKDCKKEAWGLLDELYDAVNMIFAGKEQPPTSVAATERSTGASPPRAPAAQQVPTLRGTGDKELEGGFLPDLETQPAERGVT